MSIETCIAHAIQSELDIVEALPEIHDIPMEELEAFVERFICQVQESLSSVIRQKGAHYLRAKDAPGLCATCLEAGICLPPRMLLKMCQTIINLTTVDAKFILDTQGGQSLYYMKIALV